MPHQGQAPSATHPSQQARPPINLPPASCPAEVKKQTSRLRFLLQHLKVHHLWLATGLGHHCSAGHLEQQAGGHHPLDVHDLVLKGPVGAGLAKELEAAVILEVQDVVLRWWGI